MDLKAFGKQPTGDRLRRIQQSPNYSGGAFHNLEPTEVMRQDASYVHVFLDFLKKPANTVPKVPMQSVHTDLNKLSGDQLQIVWFGHSSYLIHYKGRNILVDPIFSGSVSPVAGFNKAFPGSDVYHVKDMPPVDLLVITHDHYDHLDYETVVKLRPKVSRVCASLGVGSHLEHWGYDPQIITELDWNELLKLNEEITLTAVPARHFSGRLVTRGKTLWSGFVLQWNEYRLLLGGDTGYGAHLKNIGEQYGPFDVALLECGQYGKNWPHIHMTPEETVQAGIDLGAKAVIPVHWGKFSLAFHPWDEPVKRFTKEAAKRNFPVIVPTNGLPIVISRENI